MSNFFWPHGLQQARPLCPSSTPGVYSNSGPSSRWCHPTISSSVVPFSSCLPSIFPSIRVFSNESALHIRWPKYWSLASVLPNSLFNFLSIWLDIKNLLLVSRWKHGSVWVLGFVWCPMRQLWHWSVQSFKCSFKGSRDLQIPRIQWPLTYLNLQFILFLISKKFPYFFCHWTGISKICNYLVFSLGIFSWYFSYITKWRLWHLISFLKDALFRTLFSKCHLKLCAIKLLFFIY